MTFRRIEVDATNETGTAVSDETVTFVANDVTIEDCYIHDGGRTGIYVAGMRNLFQRNVIENFKVGLKLNHENMGRGLPTEVTVRRNLFVNTGVSIELGVCANNDLYGNVMIGTGRGPGDDGRQFGIQIEGLAHHNNFFNNTIVLSGEGGDHHGVRMHQQAGEGNVFQNNLIYFYDDDDDDDYLFFQGQDALMPHADYNLYFTDGPMRWYRGGNLYSSLADWTMSEGMPDENSLLVDPLFVTHPRGIDPLELSIVLSEGSPAIDRGAPVEMHTALPYVDFFGHPYEGAPDIGAFEFRAAVACEGEQCVAGQTCEGGTLEDFCCVGGTCAGPAGDAGTPTDAGTASDGGAGLDGGPGSDAGPGNDGGPDVHADEGCSCRVGSRSSIPAAFVLFAFAAFLRRRVAAGKRGR